MFDVRSFISVNDFTSESVDLVNAYIRKGGSGVILEPNCDKGRPPFPIPGNLYVLDCRYGSPTLVRGCHARLEGIWTQYSDLDTGLARNITITDVIDDSTQVESWRSECKPAMQPAPYEHTDPDFYHHNHNHYQNFHSEVWNFSRNLNGVAIWGDSAALVPGAKSWGGFFSARSWPLKWEGYTPASVSSYEDNEFDAALVGIEVDVLNAGKPWPEKSNILDAARSKVGVQVVGFGQRNTAAIEIRNEDTEAYDKDPSCRRGAWQFGVIARNALSNESTFISLEENGVVARGVDFHRVKFSDGAIRLTSNGARGGVLFDDGRGGAIYSDDSDSGGVLCLRAGEAGLKIYSNDGGQVIFDSSKGGADAVPSNDIAVSDLIERIDKLEDMVRLLKGRLDDRL